jgi:uncharacterized phage protein (TIGR02220 family)
MRSFLIPENFFKALSEKPKLYSRVWFYWLNIGYADEILEPEFLEKLKKIMPVSKSYTLEEIKEIYIFGVQLLREGAFEIVNMEEYTKKKKDKHTKEEKDLSKKVIECLNQKTGSTFSFKSTSNLELIIARIRDGYLYEDFERVIDNKCNDWLNTDFQMYLRPITLFNKTKFENYLNINNNGITKTTTKFDNLLQAVYEAKADFGFGNNNGGEEVNTNVI